MPDQETQTQVQPVTPVQSAPPAEAPLQAGAPVAVAAAPVVPVVPALPPSGDPLWDDIYGDPTPAAAPAVPATAPTPEATLPGGHAPPPAPAAPEVSTTPAQPPPPQHPSWLLERALQLGCTTQAANSVTSDQLGAWVLQAERQAAANWAAQQAAQAAQQTAIQARQANGPPFDPYDLKLDPEEPELRQDLLRSIKETRQIAISAAQMLHQQQQQHAQQLAQMQQQFQQQQQAAQSREFASLRDEVNALFAGNAAAQARRDEVMNEMNRFLDVPGGAKVHFARALRSLEVGPGATPGAPNGAPAPAAPPGQKTNKEIQEELARRETLFAGVAAPTQSRAPAQAKGDKAAEEMLTAKMRANGMLSPDYQPRQTPQDDDPTSIY